MKKKILIIDDENLITTTINRLLLRQGYYTEIANSGNNAIEKTGFTDFDLFITDIRMAEIDGIETIKIIKEQIKLKKMPDIPVLFITAFAENETYKKAREFGKVIFKPFDLNEFLQTVAQTLNPNQLSLS
jgi:CheY-like chemotaxis protein